MSHLSKLDGGLNMLVEVSIKNFAIIDDININFTRGLNIMTGETGSGKSILVEAIGIILGSRSSKDLIQTGSKKAILQGVFYMEDNSVLKDTLNEYSISLDSDNLLIVTKEINLDGPSLSKINGRSITVSMLKDITKKLVDIFGQHEHQSLLDSSNHKSLIDNFGDKRLFDLKVKLKEEYKKALQLKREFNNLDTDSSQRNREIDLLKFQIEEISEASLEDENEENLLKEYARLSNVNTIVLSINKTIEYISEDEFKALNALELINKSVILLKDISEHDDEIDKLFKRLESISFELEDFSREIIDYSNGIDTDEERLNYLNNRISLIHRLKRKYGASIPEIIDFKDQAQKRLSVLENYEVEISKINKQIAEVEKNLNSYSEELSNSRKKIALVIEEKIKSQLNELNMTNVDFKVDFSRRKEFAEDGYDKIEFLISTNPGESLKPLSKIASGGEMSRIMLAFKSTLAFFDKIPTMIFDEIDTGISGRTAQIVGEKILKTSRDHQVICISHLPQIAALADTHFLIDKSSDEKKSRTSIKKLTEDERVEEMARILGGVDLTDTTLKHAREMIEMSKKIKEISD